jgi:predicted nucleic acid-binding Zn ribbon protein
MKNSMNCESCGKPINKKDTICSNCGLVLKRKKPLYKRAWFWLLIALAGIGGGALDDASGSEVVNKETAEVTTTEAATVEVTYEIVSIDEMLNELSTNALRAEKLYQDKYIEIEGAIIGFDSDGTYITLQPANTDEYYFISVLCYITSDTQLDLLLDKNVGDIIKIKGKVTSVGEILGYSVDIDEIQ